MTIMTMDEILSRSASLRKVWMTRFAEFCPHIKSHIRTSYATTLASYGIETDEQLKAVSREELPKMRRVGKGAIELHDEYLHISAEMKDDEPVAEVGAAIADGINWSEVIKTLRLQAKRDMNQAIDLTTVHSDVPNAQVRALLMQSNAALLSRLADAFAQGIGG